MADGGDKDIWDIYSRQQRDTKLSGYEYSFVGLIVEKLKEFSLCPKLLYFGCGSGLWFLELSKVSDYIGADQNFNMVRNALDLFPEAKGRFLQVDWDTLPFKDGAFDVVFTSAVIQHNSHGHKDPILREFLRVLKLGGIYLAAEVTHDQAGYDDGYTWDAEGWKVFLEKYGFIREEFISPCIHIFKKQ